MSPASPSREPPPPAGTTREVAVRYFAAAREAAGVGAETLRLEEGATVRRLLEETTRRHPALARLAGALRVAVDERFAGPEEPLPPGSTVALLPPVSGG